MPESFLWRIHGWTDFGKVKTERIGIFLYISCLGLKSVLVLQAHVNATRVSFKWGQLPPMNSDRLYIYTSF